MKTLLICFLCLGFLYGTRALVNSGSDFCIVQSSGCLGGMNVSSTYTRGTSTCRDTISYTFVKSQCDISNFVTNMAKPESLSACAAAAGIGYNKEFCAALGNVFSNPFKIEISSSCSDTVTVSMVVPTGDYQEGLIGVKGGLDCKTCSLKVYVPLSATAGACSSDIHCDDKNACTVDRCDGPCGTCTHTQTDPNCGSCNNYTDCSGMPFIDACTSWTCDYTSETCMQVVTPGCVACNADKPCPTKGDPTTTCVESYCDANAGICKDRVIDGCCNDYQTETEVDACYTCTRKFGCGLTTDFQCAPTNSTGNFTYTGNSSIDCSTYSSGDGSSGDGVEGGTVAAIVIPIAVSLGVAGLAGATLLAAGAFLIAKKMQRGAIASQLQAIGFTAEESSLICNSELYKQAGESNPFFVTTDDSGQRVLNVAGAGS